jgi:uncharacterized membrane protein YphA (DoxX/SURF4 family)
MANFQSSESKLDRIYWALRLSLGSTAFLAGADKFFNKMTDWEKYLSPVAERNLPISGRNFMRLVGVIEMGVGGLILGRKPRLGALIASGWLTAIAANLVTEQDWWDIAARDVNMAVGALALAGLDEVRSARLRTSQPATLTGVARRIKESEKRLA